MTQQERAALIAGLSPEEKKALLNELMPDKSSEKSAYERLRNEFMSETKKRCSDYRRHGKSFIQWLRQESGGFAEILKEYGHLKRDGQLGFTLVHDGFRFHVKGCRVKGFDERADIAAKRLTEFLREWVQSKEGGEDNPMYTLAMTMIQRNEAGDLDYKSISRLYELEDKFNDPEYSEIMQLFKESNVVETTATNFYFEERTEGGKWNKIEVSFNRL